MGMLVFYLIAEPAQTCMMLHVFSMTTYSKDPASSLGVQSENTQGKRRLPFITELHRSRRRTPSQDITSTTIPNPAVTAAFLSEFTNADMLDKGGYCEGALKTGVLSKTSIGRREGSRPGPTRQRRFRLTEEALEYFHQFSHVSNLISSATIYRHHAPP